MKQKSLLDLSIELFITLIIGTLAIWWFAMLLKGFWGLAVYAVSSPFHVMATFLVLVLLYYWRREEIHQMIAGFKRKIEK